MSRFSRSSALAKAVGTVAKIQDSVFPLNRLIEKGIVSLVSKVGEAIPERRIVTSEMVRIIIDFIKQSKYWKLGETLGGISRIPIDQSSRFQFIGGLPRIGHAYAAHPVYPGTYIKLASFHPYLLDEKRSDFLKLCAGLGAKRVELRDDKGSRESTTVGLDIPAGSPFIGNVSSQTTLGTSFRMDVVMDGHNCPRIPDGLRWIASEPLWQGMAEARINYNASSYDVSFQYERDFGITASVAAMLGEFGIGIGGNFQAVLAMDQIYKVTF